ncbi:phage integrase N-terminal SAM-like domain-containing protein [Paracoccus aestuarii]|uniref:phage integrase N-terminal SAM-like domain-containing protein n=1 Tax=Paracoccus aestuarii TaxID=453842 RepID=UPI001F0C4C03|nr:phage integrase N-terminal SAM-like domain-containing protein [Paracoccus aestuarii]
MARGAFLRSTLFRTATGYLHAVTKFSRYFDRSPDQLGLEEVRAFQVYLVSQGISWPALNQTVCALRFFYGVTLNLVDDDRFAAAFVSLGVICSVPASGGSD